MLSLTALLDPFEQRQTVLAARSYLDFSLHPPRHRRRTAASP